MPRLACFLFSSSAILLTVVVVYIYTNNMYRGILSVLVLALAGAAKPTAAADCTNSSSTPVDLNWHRPNSTYVNNLTQVINGTGVHGFIFNSSNVPATASYGTYNWCNMPHVRPQEYVRPAAEFKLEYVEVIHRHHKRTPYASNTFPRETYGWLCDDEALFFYGTPRPDGSSVQINWLVQNTSDSNPFAPQGFNGSCQFPQITGQGLNDSRQHGSDLFAVYHSLLNFLPATFDPSMVHYRVTNNVITSQVAGQIVQGMYPGLANTAVSVAIQPASIDSLEPTYSCSSATSLYASYGVGSSASNWTQHLTQSAALFARLDAVSGVNTTDPAWHSWFDHYFDNLSARLCHAKPLPCSSSSPSRCITQDDADAVFRRGEYEYSFIYRDSPQSLTAATASFGVWTAELASNLRQHIIQNDPSSKSSSTNIAGDKVIYRHNVAHDGSMSRLLSILQVDVMVWPGMGAEVVFELYSNSDTHSNSRSNNECGDAEGWYIRILWGGKVLRSSNPSLGLVDMIPVSSLLEYFDGLVGVKAARVPGLCSG